MYKLFILFFTLFFSGCSVNAPKGIEPVNGFNLLKYLGTWYEIARLDHSFERGLSEVTADYSLREDGGVKVLNKGFDEASSSWKEAEGKAYFVKDPGMGHLKVSFFGPFYGAYVIFDLDNTDYRYALVAGPDRGYLWILSRTPRITAELKTKLLSRAKTAGYDIDKLVFVKQHTKE